MRRASENSVVDFDWIKPREPLPTAICRIAFPVERDSSTRGAREESSTKSRTLLVRNGDALA